jgi:hypothetical protein
MPFTNTPFDDGKKHATRFALLLRLAKAESLAKKWPSLFQLSMEQCVIEKIEKIWWDMQVIILCPVFLRCALVKN